MIRCVAILFVVWFQMTSLNAQPYEPAFQPDEMEDRPAGPPNEVLVLGTPHLRDLPDNFQPNMVGPIIENLANWSPDFIAIENTSGLRCAAMKQMPSRFQPSTVSRWCYDTFAAGMASGLDVYEANAQIEDRLERREEGFSAEDRRRNALLFLAAGEPASALVQWLYLQIEERIAADGLTEELVTELERAQNYQNEVNLIAAPVAVRSGLERLWSVDAQDFYAGKGDDDDEAYAAAITTAWNNPAGEKRSKKDDALKSALGEPDGLLDLYRAFNAPEYAALAYASDFGAALVEPSPGRYGRRYVSYWETRNLRMVANMREVLGRSPGSKMLAIVGVSHKGYYEAYLSQMRDVELIDVLPMLSE